MPHSCRKKPNQLSVLYVNVPKETSVVLILQVDTFKKKTCYYTSFRMKEIIFTVCNFPHSFPWDESLRIKNVHWCRYSINKAPSHPPTTSLCQKKQMPVAFVQPALNFDKEAKWYKANKYQKNNARNLTSNWEHTVKQWQLENWLYFWFW